MAVMRTTPQPAPQSNVPTSRLVTAIAMLLPVLILALVFEYWPAVRSLYLMFFDWNLVSQDPEFVGFQNFRTIVNDSRFITSIRNTVSYAAILAPLQIVLPLGMALVLRPLATSRLSLVYRTLLFLPMVISLPVAAVIWLWMLNPVNGVVNGTIEALGGRGVNWLNEPRPAMASVIVVAAWSSIGFNILLYLTALEGIPRDVRDAARLDGASEWALFRGIEWPLISPTFFFIVLTTVLFVNNEIFGVINILTHGGPYSSTTNVLYYLYERGFRFFQAGEASALAITLVGFFLLVTWIQFRVGERKVHYGS
ncbi:MAG: sugar ABC transporter permease [Chloroflexota bacterium]|nr:sugar ABC transporter permease [Chloroflexota bacterium]